MEHHVLVVGTVCPSFESSNCLWSVNCWAYLLSAQSLPVGKGVGLSSLAQSFSGVFLERSVTSVNAA